MTQRAHVSSPKICSLHPSSHVSPGDRNSFPASESRLRSVESSKSGKLAKSWSITWPNRCPPSRLTPNANWYLHRTSQQVNQLPGPRPYHRRLEICLARRLANSMMCMYLHSPLSQQVTTLSTFFLQPSPPGHLDSNPLHLTHFPTITYLSLRRWAPFRPRGPRERRRICLCCSGMGFGGIETRRRSSGGMSQDSLL